MLQSQFIPPLQVEKPSDILAAEKLLFPGVGAYEQAMGALKDRGYIDAVREYVQAHLHTLATWNLFPSHPHASICGVKNICNLQTSGSS